MDKSSNTLHKSNDDLAQEMAAFCQQRVEGRVSRRKLRRTFMAALSIVVAALLSPSLPGGGPKDWLQIPC